MTPGPAPSFTRTLETPGGEYSRGTVFAGRFEVIEELGAGGMGKVLRAFDKEVGEEVALKLLHPEIALDKRTVERFRNEIKLARKITHKNVCRMHELHQDGKTLFITMEFVSGQDLKGLIKQTGALTTGKAISIARQVAGGLAEAHGLGVVHRDLKPQNIMVDKDGNAKVMDFGIARSLLGAGVTAEGTLIGTPDYMSPEQVEGKEADQRSDLYSLGVILFEMVTGRVPFEGDTPLSIAYKHKNELPIAPRKLNSQVPEPFNKVILRCLEKEKASRYQTAEELLSDLALVEAGLPVTERVAVKTRSTAQRSALEPTRLRRFLVPGLAVFGIAAAALVLWRGLPNKKNGVVYPPVNENSVAVISFENQTGDPAYDTFRKSIPSLLITSLEQQAPLHVATWERMRDILKQMGKGGMEVIDQDSGFEICRREGIGAIVIGSFIKLGDTFVTDVKVLDSRTKHSLKSASSRGTGIDSVFAQIDELSRQIASGLGPATSQAPASLKPIAELTTDSVEAYNLFVKGSEEYVKLNFEDAKQFLERAVEIDPSFAIAYLGLSRTFRAMADPKAARGALDNAIRFSAKATEKERLRIEASSARYIERDQAKYLRFLKLLAERYPREKDFHHELATYYMQTSGELDKAVEEYRRALDLDPENTNSLNMLGVTYMALKDHKNALTTLNRCVALSPGDANPLDSVAGVYYDMGDLDKAIEKFKEALVVKPNFFYSLMQIAHVYALKEDYPEAVKWLDRLISIVDAPGLRLQGYFYLGFHDFWGGRTAKAKDDIQKGVTIANEIGNRGAVAVADSIKGWIALDQGDLENSRRFFESHLEYVVNVRKLDDYYSHFSRAMLAFAVGMIELKLGRTESAKLQLTEVDTVLTKDDQESIRYLRDVLRAEISIFEGRPEKVISEFATLPPIEPPSSQYFEPVVRYNMPPLKDVLGRAYALKGDLDKAISAYEALITFDPKGKSRYLIHPKYHYRLAKLYEQTGDITKAKARYERFLELWKDADPSQPEVNDARTHLRALK